jgi:hypothetical protein
MGPCLPASCIIVKIVSLYVQLLVVSGGTEVGHCASGMYGWGRFFRYHGAAAGTAVSITWFGASGELVEFPSIFEDLTCVFIRAIGLRLRHRSRGLVSSM